MSDPAPRNKTLSCTADELGELSGNILRIESDIDCEGIDRRFIGGDFFEIASFLPDHFADLVILDPPYNLTKNFHGTCFRKQTDNNYASYFGRIVDLLLPKLKPNASLYVCSDWQTSAVVHPILQERLFVRNRITWEREKGRGSSKNWKNNTEDIWFCTNSEDYYFDVDSVKLKRRVLAPYRVNGKAKDWSEEQKGNYRMTYPSNIWTDLTVPFWSMPENTPHPTQKPEKLVAKLILASSKRDDFIFDPFSGSGTSVVVAEKLGRRWCGIDINTEYLCWAQKRIHMARDDTSIQGYKDSVFWERNSLSGQQKGHRKKRERGSSQGTFF